MIAYERLEAWRRAHTLALEVFAATDLWPKTERYGLTAQTRRAALSISTNIAEGSAKRGGREFGRFLDIALGSLAELRYLLRFSPRSANAVARRLGRPRIPEGPDREAGLRSLSEGPSV